MAIRSVGFSLAVMLLLVGVVGALNTNLLLYVCNTEIIPSGSSFYGPLGNVLLDLEQNTASISGYDYKTSSPGSPSAYGEAICIQSLSQSDCTTCLLTLGNSILNICGNAIGAQVDLTDCYMRYEQYSFYYQLPYGTAQYPSI